MVDKPDLVTKEQVADYINWNFRYILDGWERSMIQEKLDPELATALIKLLGDCTVLIEARENKSNE